MKVPNSEPQLESTPACTAAWAVHLGDKQAALPTTTPIGIQDLLRTVLYLMGIDSRKIYNTPLGRPVPLVNGGRIVKELV